jgi:hypothetical protein
VGRAVAAGPAADQALVGRRVLVVPNYLQGTRADRPVAPVRSAVPVGEDGDARQLAMLASNPATAYLLLNRYIPLRPGDWIGQDMANSAIGQYVSMTRTPVAVPAADLVYRELGIRGLWVVNWLRDAPRAEIESVYAELSALVEPGVISAAVEAT